MSEYWKLECTEMVRHLINDVSDTPIYSDSRLYRLLVISALQMSQEVSFNTTYTIDISLGTISPDPSAEATKDNAFINLLCLKAAVILLDGEVRYYSINSIQVSDGPSSINTTARSNFVKSAAQMMYDKYSQMKMLHQAGEAGAAILTPYTVSSLSPTTRFQ